jgi:hypothetical protein
MQNIPPICAMFLTKFDVHTGYELRWFKSLDDNLYTSNDLEFKSMPSGLHSVNTDTICFVKRKGDLDVFLYGISIFKQNSHLQQINNDGTVDRSKVKLYSLGILIDPVHLENLEEYRNWKPKIYSVAWNYKSDLSQLLTNFMNLSNDNEEKEFFNKFDSFFNNHSYKQLKDSINISNNLEINKDKISPPSLKPVKSKASILSSFSDKDFRTDHMIDTLIPFVNDFGPLIFKIWKISLLRKSIILYSPYNSSSICIDGNDEILHDNFNIGDMSKFLFCMSLISSIPKNLEDSLKKSVKRDITDLLFNRPIYNVCVNDIYELVKLDTNYLASTTDQIIIEKEKLYDYSIRLPLNVLYNNSVNVPEIHNSITDKLEYASPKDYERFKIIYSKLNNNTAEENPIANKVSESRSIQELIWNGLSWWASAGETFTSIHEEFNIEFEYFDNLSSDTVEKLIMLVGYFQQITIKLFNGLIELKERHDIENGEDSIMILDAHDMIEIGLDPYSSSDCAFVVELIKVWWKMDSKVGNYFDDLCYWY